MPVRTLVFLLAAVAAWIPVATASAAPSKPFAMTVAPVTAWAGVTDDASVTLTNLTSSQTLGSADITVPDGFVIVSRSPFDTASSGNVIRLRSLGLGPKDSLTITFRLRMPCVAGAYDWRVGAKQSNDFSGPPGNAFGPLVEEDSQLTTTVEGSCKLRFAAQPAAAVKNEQIRADAFQPASTNLVSVEAIDGRPTGAERLTWFDGTITVRLAPTSYLGRLSPPAPSSQAIAGLASFGNLRIDAAGVYNLRATTNAAGFSSGDSAAFTIVDVAARCSAAGCTARVGDSMLTGTGIEDEGLALLSQNLGPQPVCAGYTPPTGAWYEFELVGVTGDITVETVYSKAAVKSVGNVSALEICFAAPKEFVAKGEPRPFDYDGDGDVEEGESVGLLPDCTPTSTGPCIVRRSGTTGGGAIVTFFVPKGWEADPRYH